MPGSFDAWSDEQLTNGMLILAIACGRSRSALTRQRKKYFCALFRVLEATATSRGQPSPSAPFHAPAEKHLIDPPAL